MNQPAWSLITKVLDSFVVFLVRQLSRFLQRLPHESALALGRFIGLVLSKTYYRRRLAYANLKAAFGSKYSPAERKKIVEEHFINLAQISVEVLRFPKLTPDFLNQYISVINREGYEEIARSSTGTILMTPHFGNWELTQILSALVGKPLHVLARQQKHSKLDEFLNELRSSHGSTAIHKGGAIRDLIRALKGGGMVGALGDLSGGRDGLPVIFFGRKTTAPTGIFEIAERTGSQILPVFMVRKNGPYHEICISELFSLARTKNGELDLSKTVQNYYDLLEKWISRYPSQWFWMYKRWKICFTKKIVILKDENTGHNNQSEAISRELKEIASQSELSDFEFKTIEVKYKSVFHRKLFYSLAFFLLPFAQGRMNILNYFLTPESASLLAEYYGDIVISTGSSLIPINLFLKKENLSKSVVVMKPSFPYSHKLFDLIILPMHDRFPKKGKTVQTLISPNRVTPTLLEEEARNLLNLKALKLNEKKGISLFIGGRRKAYDFNEEELERCMSSLKDYAERNHCELLITTSRRTSSETSDYLKRMFGRHASTKLLVIANEANIPNVTYGMLGLSEIVVVTEDSVSMISEAVSSQKQVLVLKSGNGKLAKKHYRFHKLLDEKKLIRIVDSSNLIPTLNLLNGPFNSDILREQSVEIQGALKKLL